MKKRFLSALLAVVMALGIVTPALAYSTADFSDVPPDHWAYESVMKMADAGVIKGTGNNLFSPELKVSAAQFLTLVGRVVFPDVTADGADWYSPYVSKAQEAGLLTGSQVDVNNVEAEITRYDMAVILRASAKKLGAAEKAAEQSQVTDYGMIPTMYADAVLAVYGMGLIQGDQNGNFNGQNTMSRQEVATVMDRLTTLQKKTSQGGNTGTTPETPDVDYTLDIWTGDAEGKILPGEKIGVGFTVKPSFSKVYGENADRSKFTCTSSDPSVAEISEADGTYWYVTAISEGTATVTITDPYGVSGTAEITVIPRRENVGTKTYKFTIRTANFEEHSLRGGAYTTNHFAYEVPYKLYHTRDGGKTSQLVYEGVSPAKSGPSFNEIELDLPEDLFYSADAGFYISAEAEIDGQRMVTSDLRTDGRAYPTLVRARPGQDAFTMEIPLTPPTGEKVKFTVEGAVFYRKENENDLTYVGEGFTVRIYLKNGQLVAETKTDSNGEFALECEVDKIDGGFDKDTEQYYLTASGEQDGVFMQDDGKNKNGEFILDSLNHIGGNPYGQYADNRVVLIAS